MNSEFIKGLELSEVFFVDGIKPIINTAFPDLAYSAGLLGTGSDVLGYDTPQSMDHDWGPRLMLFLSEPDHKKYKDKIDLVLRKQLPPEIHGYPTNYGTHDDGTAKMILEVNGDINHRVEVHTIKEYFQEILNFDPTGDIKPMDWVCVPENNYLMLTSGRVFHDGLGQLELIRKKLSYYPHDVWLYLFSSQWQRISQEEHFMGRCGQVADDLGSRIIAARLVLDLMRLCFLMEKTYAPYVKWFGTAFARLDCAEGLIPVLTNTLKANTWEERQNNLSIAYEYVAGMHNALNITAPLPEKVSPFHKRPFMVIHAELIASAIRDQITSAEVLALPKYLGGVDQFVDSTDALNHINRIKSVF